MSYTHPTGRAYYRKTMGELFYDLDELEEIVRQLDVAVEVPIHYDNPESDFLPKAEKYKGIYNTGTHELARVVSTQYALLQHRDAYVALVSALRMADLEVFGVVKNNRDSVAVELTFDGIIVDDGVEGIEMGLKLANSYNASSAFKGWGWGLRKVCSNGMYARRVIPEMSFSNVHRGEIDAVSVDEIYNLVTAARSRLMNYETVIDESKLKVMDFPESESVIATIAPVIGSYKGAIKAVDRHWNEELDTNRWDVYNIATAYASHEPMSENMFHNIQRRAEDFLAAETVTIIVPEDEEAIEASVV